MLPEEEMEHGRLCVGNMTRKCLLGINTQVKELPDLGQYGENVTNWKKLLKRTSNQLEKFVFQSFMFLESQNYAKFHTYKAKAIWCTIKRELLKN